MKHLDKFFNYITESKVINKDELDMLLIPFIDMNIRYDIYNRVETKGPFSGNDITVIAFSLHTMLSSDDKIYDNNIWEFLDEILSLKPRLGDKVSLSMKPSTIGITFVNGNVDINSNDYKIQAILNAVNVLSWSRKGDFIYSLTKKIEDGKLILNWNDSFSVRKWNNFKNALDIDLSKYNIKVFPSDAGSPWQRGHVIITPK